MQADPFPVTCIINGMLRNWLKSTFLRWRDGDDSSWSARFVSLAVLCVISFVMLWLGDKLNGEGMAVTRYMARVQAPLAGQFYPDHARSGITVLTYDDEFLRQEGASWPITYAHHAGWLLRLTEDPKARPKAVFIDITFTQERDDTSLDELRQALCTVQHEYGVPVFLAALPSPQDGTLRVRNDLASTVSLQGKPCFTLVGVRHTPDPVDGMTWSYPLTTHAAGQAWVSGTAPGVDAPAFRSAAMALAQDAAGIDLGEEREPLAIVWGSRAPPDDSPFAVPDYCGDSEPVWRQLMPHLLRQMLGGEPAASVCPFHRTISMTRVGEMADEELAPYLAGTYLMIGAAVSGYNDLARSPVHGLIPGVHVHAMALDNLLVYRDQYKRHSEWSLPPTAELFWAGVAAVFSVFVVHILFRRLGARPSRHMPANCHGWGASTTLWQRIRQLPVRAIAWLLRIWMQVVAAMLLIAALQSFFRIGMLPVVELIGMTILAEGLGYLEKTREFFAPHRDECAGDAKHAPTESAPSSHGHVPPAWPGMSVGPMEKTFIPKEEIS